PSRVLEVRAQASRWFEARRRRGALGLGEQRLVGRVEDERFHREIETAQGRQLRETLRHTAPLQQPPRGADAALPLDRAQEVAGPVPGLTAGSPIHLLHHLLLESRFEVCHGLSSFTNDRRPQWSGPRRIWIETCAC